MTILLAESQTRETFSRGNGGNRNPQGELARRGPVASQLRAGGRIMEQPADRERRVDPQAVGRGPLFQAKASQKKEDFPWDQREGEAPPSLYLRVFPLAFFQSL